MQDKKNAMNEFSKMVLEALNESETNKTLKWVKPWRVIDCEFRNGLSGHKYTGLYNILACALTDFSDPRYLTFNQIKKANGKLIKGSKSTRLLAWRFGKIKQDDGTEKSIPFATSWCLFNVEQTEDLNLPEINNDVLNEDLKPNESVLDIYKALNVTFTHETSNGANYTPQTDSISLPNVQQYDNADRWANTALHELVHWTAKRVDRDCSSYHFDTESRAMEELVAELGAMYLCMNLKINGYMDEQNLAYIKSWRSAANGKNGDKYIYKACKLAEIASNYILETAGVQQLVEV